MNPDVLAAICLLIGFANGCIYGRVFLSVWKEWDVMNFIKRFFNKPKWQTIEECREAGKNAGMYGSNRTNCHPGYFKSAAQAKAHHDGYQLGQALIKESLELEQRH